jgi:acyl-CoA hydrolase
MARVPGSKGGRGARAAKSARESAAIMTEIVGPNDANTHGTVHGGKVLKWIDVAAGIVAIRHARTPVVTAAIERVDFIAPIRVGHFAILTARLNGVGRSSMEVSVEVEGEDPWTGTRHRATSAIVTYVAQDEFGVPVEVPPLRLETPEDERRAREAARRRAARRARKSTGR